MPKVFLSEQDKLNDRLASWVYGELRIRKMTQQDLADERGVSRQAIGKKLKNRSFDYEDLCCFVRVFQPDGKEVMRLLGE